MLLVSCAAHKTRFLLKSFLPPQRRKLFFLLEGKCCINSKTMSYSDSFRKPPNVLIYTGDNRKHVFKNAAAILQKCLNPDKYVIYELEKSQVLVQPWKENTNLLVMICDTIEESLIEEFRNYFAKDGKILCICSNFTVPDIEFSITSFPESLVQMKYKNMETIQVHHGKISYNCAKAETLAADVNNIPILVKAVLGQGILVASEVYLVFDASVLFPNESNHTYPNTESFLPVLKSILVEIFGLEAPTITLPTPTAGYVIAESSSQLNDLISKLSITEVPLEKSDVGLTVPLIFENQTADSIQFDKGTYYSKLKSRCFGHTVIFFPIVTSTMIPSEYFSDQEGAVVIAGRQTCGRGRGGNQWISPEGCAMFTLHFTLSLSSQLGQRMSVVQHMATLAVVHGIRKIPGYEKLDLRLKWPNDLYFESDKKIGGVLVNTTVQGNVIHAHVGIGINVSNQRPTMCINRAIEAHNNDTGDSLPAFKVEEVIAFTLSELEYLVQDFMKSGSEHFLSLYYSYWMHTDQRVTLSSLEQEVTIKGLDDYGFLIVETDDGKKLTLQPDGNRFDIMKNLIISKA